MIEIQIYDAVIILLTFFLLGAGFVAYLWLSSYEKSGEVDEGYFDVP